MRLKTISLLITLSLLATLLGSCGGDEAYAPKPTAYMRLTYPEHSYHLYDTLALPFTFECADSAEVVWKKNGATDKWLDILYPCYGGIFFLTYHTLSSPKDLTQHISDACEMLSAHYTMSSGINEQQFVRPEAKVYATTYRLGGKNVATTYQFWATDSTRHFLYGNFYLDRTPNNDSLAPLIEYLQADLDHMLESLRWR